MNALGRWLSALVVLLALAVGATLGAAPAQAAGATGTLKFTVTSAGGDTVAGAWVIVYATSADDPGEDPEDGDYTNVGQTNASGVATISGLPAGSYKAWIEAAGYVGQWYDLQKTFANATAVVAPSGGQNAFTATLVSSLSQITGTVTAGGAPLAGVVVQAHPASDPSTSSYAPSTTDAAGHYSLSLAAGDWKLSFTPPDPYDPVWSGGSFSPEGSSNVTVAAADTTTYDAVMSISPHLTGTITGDDGQPVTGQIELWSDFWTYTKLASGTVSGGTFTLRGLPSVAQIVAAGYGSASLKIIPSNGYLPTTVPVAAFDQYYPEAGGYDAKAPTDPWAAASPMAVTVQKRPPTDAAFAGTTSPARADIRITAVSTANSLDAYSTYSATDGSWSIPVPAGSYHLTWDPAPDQLDYIAGHVCHNWSDYVCSQTGWDSYETPVSVASGATSTWDGFGPVQVPSIMGTLTDSEGKTLKGATVELRGGQDYDGVPDDMAGPWASAVTDAFGRYAIHLPPTTNEYTGEPIYYSDLSLRIVPADDFHQVVWLGHPGRTVIDDVATTGVNQVVPTAGALTGTLTGPDSAAVAGVGVVVTSTTSPTSYTAVTASNGNWKIGQIPPGSYTVQFATDSDAWFHDFYGQGSHDPTGVAVTVTAGKTKAAVSATLRPAATISGTVRGSETTAGLAGAVVTAYSDVSAEVATATTAADGSYRLPALAPGTYRIKVAAPDAEHVTEWYDDGTSWSTGLDVVAAQGVTTINSTLTRTAALSGTVTGTGDVPLSGVTVHVTDTSGVDVLTGVTGPDGMWRVPGLPTGTYRIRVEAPADSGYADGWWSTQAAPDVTADVALVIGDQVTGKDVKLKPAGSGTTPTDPADPGTTPPTLPGGPKGGGPVVTAKPVKLVLKSRPRLSGKAKAGKVLKVTAGRWSVRGVKVTYVWKIGKKVVSHKSSVRVKKAWRHKKITVTVTARAPKAKPASVSVRLSKRIA